MGEDFTRLTASEYRQHLADYPGDTQTAEIISLEQPRADGELA